MKRIMIALAATGVLLAACGAPAQPIAAPVTQPKTEAAAPGGGAKTLAKPVFIDFYAPW
jgi:hypothetical protein